MKRVLFEGELKRNQGSYYSILEITEGASLVVTLTGTGNVDLYVKRGAKPTIYSFDAKSTGPAPSERLQVTLPEVWGHLLFASTVYCFYLDRESCGNGV